jgi:hydrogenase nickel incorporation protein HypA/HybF
MLHAVGEDEAEAIHFVPEMARVYARCPTCSSHDFALAAGRGIWLVAVSGAS